MASANRQRVTGHYSMQRTIGRNVEDEMYHNTSSLRTVKPRYRGILSNNINNNPVNLLDGYHDGYYNYRNSTRVQFNDLLTYLLKKRETSDSFSLSHCNFAGVRETFSRIMSLTLTGDRVNIYCQKVGDTIYILDEKCAPEIERPSFSYASDLNGTSRFDDSHNLVPPVRILRATDSPQSFFNISRPVSSTNSTVSSRQSRDTSSFGAQRSTSASVSSSVSTPSSTRSHSTNTTSSSTSYSQASQVVQSYSPSSWNHHNYAKNKLKEMLTDYFDVNREGSLDALSAQSFYNVYEKLIMSPDKQRTFRIMYTGEIDATVSNDHFYDANRSSNSVLLRLRLSPNRKFSWHAKQKKFTEWWSNAYLSGVNNVIVAHHSPSYSVNSFESYDLEHLNLMSGGQRRRDVCLDHLYSALCDISDHMRHAKDGEMYQFQYPRQGYARNCLQVFEESKKLLNSDIIYRMSS